MGNYFNNKFVNCEIGFNDYKCIRNNKKKC